MWLSEDEELVYKSFIQDHTQLYHRDEYETRDALRTKYIKYRPISYDESTKVEIYEVINKKLIWLIDNSTNETLKTILRNYVRLISTYFLIGHES